MNSPKPFSAFARAMSGAQRPMAPQPFARLKPSLHIPTAPSAPLRFPPSTGFSSDPLAFSLPTSFFAAPAGAARIPVPEPRTGQPSTLPPFSLSSFFAGQPSFAPRLRALNDDAASVASSFIDGRPRVTELDDDDVETTSPQAERARRDTPPWVGASLDSVPSTPVATPRAPPQPPAPASPHVTFAPTPRRRPASAPHTLPPFAALFGDAPTTTTRAASPHLASPHLASPHLASPQPPASPRPPASPQLPASPLPSTTPSPRNPFEEAFGAAAPSPSRSPFSAAAPADPRAEYAAAKAKLERARHDAAEVIQVLAHARVEATRAGIATAWSGTKSAARVGVEVFREQRPTRGRRRAFFSGMKKALHVLHESVPPSVQRVRADHKDMSTQLKHQIGVDSAVVAEAAATMARLVAQHGAIFDGL